jgi:hypothetical protein
MVIERALALDQNSAWVWNRSAFLHTYRDDPNIGIAHFEEALRLTLPLKHRFTSGGTIRCCITSLHELIGNQPADDAQDREPCH